MSDHASSRLWVMRAGFALLMLTILFFHLLPLQTSTGGLIWPDFTLCFAFAWSVRRPEYVPPLLLAGAFLLTDLLLQRPPGLWAVLALIACENLKGQSRGLRDATLMAEIASVAIWILGIAVAYCVVHAVLLIDAPALGPLVLQAVATIIAYPLVIAITHGVLGVRKAAPDELGGKGVRS
ncbi:rod shape-determining protein MreD [Tateyamaria sp.]|uniref:rod shape-determining protein MreD n=1 Tax=Tateyamaria sp. TaxID=1929288 RepID=UPI00329E7606